MGAVSDFDFFVAGLKAEGEAVLRAMENQDPAQVAEAVRLLSECRGRVVTTGVGKSAVVSQKLASTLTSTGTASFFMHPTDALHGDLGGVRTEDVLVAISNSGDTEELVELLPFLERRGVPIISIVGKVKSALGRAARATLNGHVDTEICPHNLAPTTSTTVALALCDALAVSVMRRKGISAEDFALNHPSGRLGKRLLLRVSNLMRGGDRNPTVAQDAPFMDVTHAISQGGSGIVNVVDPQGMLVGIVTDGDLRRTIERVSAEGVARLRCSEFMSRQPVTVQPEMLAYEAFRLTQASAKPLNVLSVVDAAGRSLGILKIQDIIKAGIV